MYTCDCGKEFKKKSINKKINKQKLARNTEKMLSLRFTHVDQSYCCQFDNGVSRVDQLLTYRLFTSVFHGKQKHNSKNYK